MKTIDDSVIPRRRIEPAEARERRIALPRRDLDRGHRRAVAVPFGRCVGSERGVVLDGRDDAQMSTPSGRNSMGTAIDGSSASVRQCFQLRVPGMRITRARSRTLSRSALRLHGLERNPECSSVVRIG